MLKVTITGVEYDCVSKIEPEVVYDYYYDVQTMNGTRYRKIRGKKTNYNILFYNKNHEQYEGLKRRLETNRDVGVRLTVPINATETKMFYCYATINGDEFKGVSLDGKNYFTALSVTFEPINYDEE